MIGIVILEISFNLAVKRRGRRDSATEMRRSGSGRGRGCRRNGRKSRPQYAVSGAPSASAPPYRRSSRAPVLGSAYKVCARCPVFPRTGGKALAGGGVPGATLRQPADGGADTPFRAARADFSRKPHKISQNPCQNSLLQPLKIVKRYWATFSPENRKPPVALGLATADRGGAPSSARLLGSRTGRPHAGAGALVTGQSARRPAPAPASVLPTQLPPPLRRAGQRPSA